MSDPVVNILTSAMTISHTAISILDQLCLHAKAVALNHGSSLTVVAGELQRHFLAYLQKELDAIEDRIAEYDSGERRLVIVHAIVRAMKLALSQVPWLAEDDRVMQHVETLGSLLKRLVAALEVIHERHPVLVYAVLAQVLGITPLAYRHILRLVLRLLGFDVAGPRKGSIASMVQGSVYGSVPKGSLFSQMQHFAMKAKL